MAYPTDSFYDPNRPDWLPYWIDTPTESQNKMGLAMANSGSPTLIAMSPGIITPVTSSVQYPNPSVVPGASAIVIPTDAASLAMGLGLENADIPTSTNQTWAGTFFNTVPNNPTNQASNMGIWLLAGIGLVAFMVIRK